MSKLQEALGSGKFVVTGEIGPPKGTNVQSCLHEAEEYMKETVAAVNVTDIQTAVMRVGSMAISHMLLDRGIEPVFQMVCRDRNRLALESDLLSAAVLGIENVLALTGDHIQMGDHHEAKAVYDLDSVGLLHAMSQLEKGTDLGCDMKGNPNELDGVPKFFKGCCVTPCAKEVAPQIIKLEKKVEAGAQFVQTQAVYDPKAFEAFMKRGGFEIQINVVGKEDLLDAQENPEQYPDLLVRVAGYSDYFVHLNKNMQDEVIARTEHEL